MLPSSHQSPIISPTQGVAGILPAAWDGDSLTPPSLTTAPTTTQALALAEAFADFVSTSSRLEQSYRDLQVEVASLHDELGQRNEDLKSSLAENQRVRLALQQVIDSMPCGVLVADAAGRISTINPELSSILGLRETGTTRTLSSLNKQTGLLLQTRKHAAAETEREVRLSATQGERWLQIRERSLTASQGLSALTIYIISDITTQKRAERDREAARNATVLAEITTMLAHEIRNPLASLELFAELIEQDDTERAEWISNLRAGIRSLSGTVNNVLSIHDHGTLRLERLSLGDMISNAVRFVQPLARQAGITVDWLADESEAEILGNDSALQQVLLNLTRNAVRHTPAGGRITLATERGPEGSVCVSCTDTGSGIPSAQMDRLFEAGFSGSGETPGLGLAVCNRIMQKHGGTISAHNVEGSGARFLISFPIFEQELATA